ncbi:DUF2834 domain-containing protein [Roseateles sp. BYS180W]|uniref:DUF2834 domain-containing protein n=1 Tax=Roseateles rivi TaxID=3299028 RepID=A0ABW7FTQ0_9BURK
MRRLFLMLVIFAFGALTAAAVMQYGPDGILKYQIQNLAGIQVIVDLAIALVLFIFWMWRDAKGLGRNPWIWLTITLVAGSFGPLLYLVTRKETTNLPAQVGK